MNNYYILYNSLLQKKQGFPKVDLHQLKFKKRNNTNAKRKSPNFSVYNSKESQD